ncbi:MAG: hypothetical protein KGH75_12890, partial [Rhodospirillales bacterium]|nr:hypothetical protein [Rhodospirillales bacterium]
MTQLTIGIDIGAHGAIAIFKDDKLHEIVDMPIFTVQKKSGKNKTTVNPYALANILRIYAYAYGGEIKAVMELVGATPQMGVTSAYAFGNAAGIV